MHLRVHQIRSVAVQLSVPICATGFFAMEKSIQLEHSIFQISELFK
jgi:hypothetical protein